MKDFYDYMYDERIDVIRRPMPRLLDLQTAYEEAFYALDGAWMEYLDDENFYDVLFGIGEYEGDL